MNRVNDTKQDLFASIPLSLDAPTLEHALGKRRVQAVQADGTILYEEVKDSNHALTEQLERIWNEYPNGLLDVTEDKLSAVPQEEDAVKPEEDRKNDKDKREPSRNLSVDDMEKLRSEVYLQLNDARNELWFVLELVKTLAVSQSFTNQPPFTSDQPPAKKGKPKTSTKPTEKSSLPVSGSTEPPVLPPGTYSTTPSANPAKPTHAQVHELELVLAAKQQALDECSALIDSAVSELQSMASAGDRFWKDVRTLQAGLNGKGQFAIVPKPDFGRTMAEGEKAKDIIIPYAVDEASRATRARCLAAFDLDPKKKDALTFGARNYLRLRVTLRDDSGAVVGSTVAEPENGLGVRATMEAAQMEAFDEELFHEVRGEAMRMDNSEIEPRTLTIQAADYTMSFELYDPRSPPNATPSALCDLIISAARLGLINILRQRKANIVAPLVSYTSPIPSISQPILHVLRYRRLCAVIESTLQNLAKTLQTAGIDATIEQTSLASRHMSRSDLEKLLLAKADASVLTGKHQLKIADCEGITIELAAPSRTTVRLTKSEFSLSNPEELSYIIAEDLSTQLIRPVYRQLKSILSDNKYRSTLFLDELEGVINIKGMGLLSVSLPAPFHTLYARINSSGEGGVDIVFSGHETESGPDRRVEMYDGRAGTSLRDWVQGLATKIMSIANSALIVGVTDAEV